MRKLVSPTGRTVVLLAIAATILVTAIVGYMSTRPKDPSTEPKVEGQATEVAQQENEEQEEEPMVLRTDVSKKQAIVDAAAKIDELRKADNPDYVEIEKIFTSELKEMVAKRDGEAQTTLVGDIEKSIAAAKSGQDVALNGQRISKTLIRAFYLAVKHEFEEAENIFSDKTEEGAFNKWDEAEAYFGGLKSSGYFKDNPELITRVEAAFEGGRTAIAEDMLLEMKLEAQNIDKISIRFFVGSVLREADAAGGLGAADALEKIVEAQVFYSAVSEKFEGYDQQISSALGSVETANPDTLRALFAKGLSEKVIHEAEEVLGNWGADKAAVVAREASLYMEALQEVLGMERADDTATIPDQITQLEEAVGASDKVEAERLAREVIAAVNSIKSGL